MDLWHYQKKIENNLIAVYGNLFRMRQRGDYEDWVVIEETDILPLLEPAEKFIKSIEQLIFNNTTSS